MGADEPVKARNGFVSPASVFVRVPRKNLKAEREDIVFRIEATRPDGQVIATERTSIFIGPKPRP